MFIRSIAVLAAGLFLAGAVGCCATGELPPLPAPISIDQQVGLLNERARALPLLSVRGTVVIRYTDKNGPQKQSADGQLLIKQRYGVDGARDSGDVCLIGTAFDQEVFEAGKNAEKWWFLIRLDQKTAWVGDVKNGSENESGSQSGGGGMMRADMVLDVLGISEIFPKPGELVAMTVSDEARSNNLLFLRPFAGGLAWVRREIIIDRTSGNVRQVNLYSSTGVVLVRSTLQDYRPITYRDGDEIPAAFKPVPFPHDIFVEYLTEKASIHFTITGQLGKQAEIRDHLPAAAFATPSFEGLKVIEQNK